MFRDWEIQRRVDFGLQNLLKCLGSLDLICHTSLCCVIFCYTYFPFWGPIFILLATGELIQFDDSTAVLAHVQETVKKIWNYDSRPSSSFGDPSPLPSSWSALWLRSLACHANGCCHEVSSLLFFVHLTAAGLLCWQKLLFHLFLTVPQLDKRHSF